jgi:hypothetical protein
VIDIDELVILHWLISETLNSSYLLLCLLNKIILTLKEADVIPRILTQQSIVYEQLMILNALI